VRVEDSGPREQRIAEEVRRLGEVLVERVEDVVERTVARSRRPGQKSDPVTLDSFVEIARSSAAAVALWMAGGIPRRAARPAGGRLRRMGSWPRSG
jgi:hypothetical protein